MKPESKGVSPITLTVESDWSSAAFLYQCIAFSGKSLFIKNLNSNSLQGDIACWSIFESFGVVTEFKNDAYVFNLGNGEGYSNLDIVLAVGDNTPLQPVVSTGPARAGDPAKLVADSKLANTLLKWQPKYGLDTIVKTAYNYYLKTNKTTSSS